MVCEPVSPWSSAFASLWFPRCAALRQAPSPNFDFGCPESGWWSLAVPLTETDGHGTGSKYASGWGVDNSPFGSSTVPSSAFIRPSSGRALHCSNVIMLVSRNGGPATCTAVPALLVNTAVAVGVGVAGADAAAAAAPAALRLRDGCNAPDACAACDTLVPPPPLTPLLPPPLLLLKLWSLEPFCDGAAFASSTPNLRAPAPPRTRPSPFAVVLACRDGFLTPSW